MSRRLALKVVGFVFALSALFGTALAPRANAAGVEVFRTDHRGNKTGTVVSVGNTGPTAFCAGAAVGTAGHGVKVCYL